MNTHPLKPLIPYRLLISLCIILYISAFAKAQRLSSEFQVVFELNSAHINPALGDNARQINKAIEFLNNTQNDPKIEIVSVAFCGTCSPDGPYEVNKDLAWKRLKEVERLVRDQVDLPDAIVTYNRDYIPWQWLADQVKGSDVVSKEEILAIIGEPSVMIECGKDRTIDSRIPRLRELNGGIPWQQLNDRFFSDMRMASAVIVTFREEPPAAPVAEQQVEQPTIMGDSFNSISSPLMVEETTVAEMVKEKPEWYRKMYIKTNVPAWGILCQNLALEFDLARHWSFSLPVYWSPYDYGKRTLKFRILAAVPEFRYWPKGDNTGFFINLHGGAALFNYAKGGKYRYQNHDSKRPALGGGIGIGYRFYFCRNHHWSMEIAAGAGAYKLDYDILLNRYDLTGGYYVGRRKRILYCLDQAAVTFSYSFGLRKKKK